MSGQSLEMRRARLSKFGCPVHGTAMRQIAEYPDGGHTYRVYACARRDCGIEAWTNGGPLQLMSEWMHLLETPEERERRETVERYRRALELEEKLRHRAIWASDAPYPAKVIALGLVHGMPVSKLADAMPRRVLKENLPAAKTLVDGGR